MPALLPGSILQRIVCVASVLVLAAFPLQSALIRAHTGAAVMQEQGVRVSTDRRDLKGEHRSRPKTQQEQREERQAFCVECAGQQVHVQQEECVEKNESKTQREIR